MSMNISINIDMKANVPGSMMYTSGSVESSFAALEKQKLITCVVRHRMKGLGSKKANRWSLIKSFVTCIK